MCFSTVSLACYVWCVLFRRDRLPIGREYSKPIQRINFIVSCRCRCYNYSLWVFGKSGLIFLNWENHHFVGGKLRPLTWRDRCSGFYTCSMARKPKREVSVCMAPSLETRGGVNPKGAAVSRPVSGSHGMLEGSHVPIQDNSPKKMAIRAVSLQCWLPSIVFWCILPWIFEIIVHLSCVNFGMACWKASKTKVALDSWTAEMVRFRLLCCWNAWNITEYGPPLTNIAMDMIDFQWVCTW